MQHHASVDRRFGSATIWPSLKPKIDTFPSPHVPVLKPTKKCANAVNFLPENSLNTAFIGH